MRKNPDTWRYRASISALMGLFLLFAAAADAADPRKGSQTYKLHCSMCHGETGHKAMPSAPDFYRGDGMFQSDLSLLRRIEAGKNACPSYRGILKQQDILDVIAHIRTLRR